MKKLSQTIVVLSVAIAIQVKYKFTQNIKKNAI